MIKRLWLCALLISVWIHAEQEGVRAAQDLITIVLMVKNEEAVITQTLEPFVDAGISSFFIFDTGSTDNTIPTAEHFFKTHAIDHYAIAQEPFIDFATSRNRALDIADERFPNAAFFVMPDAEWYMNNIKGLIDFCIKHRDDTTPCYLMRIQNERNYFTVPRLIRARSNARFLLAVHEGIPVHPSARVPNDINFKLGASRQGIEKSRKRWERDLVILLKEHEKDPHGSRTTFYLAQTYDCLGDAHNAYHYYKLRSEQSTFLEEDFETYYRLGKVTERLSASDPDFTWHMAFDYYSKAHDILPHRAEPLVCLAEHYWQDGAAPLNIALCFLFAKRACELEFPENDLLFVDPWVYDFKRYELVSKSAWHVGDFKNGEIATRNALKKQEMPHLLKNLAAYVDRRMQLGE